MRAADSLCVQLRGDTSLVLMGGFTAALKNNTTVSASISVYHDLKTSLFILLFL